MMELENTFPVEVRKTFCPLPVKKGWTMNNGLVYVSKYLILEHQFGKRPFFIALDTKPRRWKLYLVI